MRNTSAGYRILSQHFEDDCLWWFLLKSEAQPRLSESVFFLFSLVGFKIFLVFSFQHFDYNVPRRVCCCLFWVSLCVGLTELLKSVDGCLSSVLENAQLSSLWILPVPFWGPHCTYTDASMLHVCLLYADPSPSL